MPARTLLNMKLVTGFWRQHPLRFAALVLLASPGPYTGHVAPAKSSPGGEVLFEIYYRD